MYLHISSTSNQATALLWPVMSWPTALLGAWTTPPAGGAPHVLRRATLAGLEAGGQYSRMHEQSAGGALSRRLITKDKEGRGQVTRFINKGVLRGRPEVGSF
jgi:hypothetical protein